MSSAESDEIAIKYWLFAGQDFKDLLNKKKRKYSTYSDTASKAIFVDCFGENPLVGPLKKINFHKK